MECDYTVITYNGSRNYVSHNSWIHCRLSQYNHIPKDSYSTNLILTIFHFFMQTWSSVHHTASLSVLVIFVQHWEAFLSKQDIYRLIVYLISNNSEEYRKRYIIRPSWPFLAILELYLKFIKPKSYTKFHIKISKHAGEKCRKLFIFNILSSKRGVTHTKIDGKRWHSNLICSP